MLLILRLRLFSAGGGELQEVHAVPVLTLHADVVWIKLATITWALNIFIWSKIARTRPWRASLTQHGWDELEMVLLWTSLKIPSSYLAERGCRNTVGWLCYHHCITLTSYFRLLIAARASTVKEALNSKAAHLQTNHQRDAEHFVQIKQMHSKTEPFSVPGLPGNACVPGVSVSWSYQPW